MPYYALVADKSAQDLVRACTGRALSQMFIVHTIIQIKNTIFVTRICKRRVVPMNGSKYHPLPDHIRCHHMTHGQITDMAHPWLTSSEGPATGTVALAIGFDWTAPAIQALFHPTGRHS